MRTNYVLVDYENVQAVDLRELKREDVRVILFLGSNQAKLPFDLVIQMQSLGERAEYVQISGNGPNALDFHIAFTIGEKCATGEPSFFHVISKDQGFDPLFAYLKQRKIVAARYQAVAQLPFLKRPQLTSPATRASEFIKKVSLPTSPKPRTEKTLRNAIRAFFAQLPDSEVEEVLKLLLARGFVKIADGKVVYPGHVDAAKLTKT